MAFEPFNSVGGITVGIPPVQVINENGVATLNGLELSGLVVLGNVGNVRLYGGENGYFLQTDGEGRLTWAPAGNGGNGGNGNPGGANSQVQFNDDGNFGGDAGFTYDRVNNILTVSGNIVSYNSNSNGTSTSNNFVGNTLTVSNVSATRITATGNITASNANLGNLATANFYVGNGSLLTGVTSTNANYASYAGNVTISSQPNITSLGTLTSLEVSGNAVFGNVDAYSLDATIVRLTGNANVGNLNANAGVFATTIAGNLTTSAQPNVTSLGTLTSLTISGSANLGTVANVHITGGTSGQVLTTNGNGLLSWQSAPAAATATYVTANYQPNITSTGTLTVLDVNGTANLGNVGNVKIAGGSAGYVLITDGAGNLTWQTPANTAAGGSNTQIQFNNEGAFDGVASFTYDVVTDTVEVAGQLVANSFQMGATGYKFSNSFVFFATTASDLPNQVLWSIPVANTTAVDFTVFGSCEGIDASQTAKISSLVRGSTIAYNEYAGLAINNGVGVFSVSYNSVDETLELIVDPDTSSLTEYNIMITVYNNYP